MDPHMLDGLGVLAIIGLAAIIILAVGAMVGSGAILFWIIKALI